MCWLITNAGRFPMGCTGGIRSSARPHCQYCSDINGEDVSVGGWSMLRNGIGGQNIPRVHTTSEVEIGLRLMKRQSSTPRYRMDVERQIDAVRVSQPARQRFID